MFFYIFLVLFGLYVYKYYKNGYFHWKSQSIDGPFPFPFINDYYNYFFLPVHEENVRCMRKYGDIWQGYAFSSAEINICDPELIREIMIKDFKQYNGRNDGSMFVKYFSKVLFVRDETNGWRHVRHAVSPQFTTGKLKALYSNLHKPMKNFIEDLEERLADKNYIDDYTPRVNFKRYSWDIILNLFFSVQFNSFKIGKDDFIQKFLTAKPTGTFTNLMTFFMPAFITKILSVKITPMDTMVYNYMVKLILNCLEQRRKDTQTNYNDLLQLLLQTDLPEEEIVGQCIGLFLGGFESVAQTCGYALYELALRPDIQDKLYEEIKTHYPGDDLEIDYDKIKSCKYLEAVVNEVLRKHLAIAKVFRKALEDCELSNGLKLRKGTYISIPIYALHHNEKYWPNPNEFDPDRFLDIEPESGTYLPFGIGPRMCVAKRLAEIEVRYMLIIFLRRYEAFKTSRTSVPIKYHKFNVLFNSEDIVLGIRKRGAGE